MTGSVRGLVDADREVALLLDIVAATGSGPAVEPVAAAVARLITAATASDVCFVHVLDDSGESLTLAGATPPFDECIGQVQLRLGEGISGWVAQNRDPVVITSGKEEDPRYVPIAALRGSDFTSMASVPMETGLGGLVGVLNVHTAARREFTERDIQLLLAIGRLTAGALDQARVHRRLAARERVHGSFAEQVIAAQESERRRLAGDIHDGISQRLVSLSYRLDAAAHAVEIDDTAEASEQLEKARDLVDLTLAEARSAIGGLRPPVLDDLGLAGGLASLVSTIPEVDLDLQLADERLPEHVEVALYRIAQECLQNVVKHSRAMTARVCFAVEAGVARLEVADDGIGIRGFDPLDSAPTRALTSYGMLSMTERAELVGGRLTVRSMSSGPRSGTTVTVTVPLGDARGAGQAD